MAHNGIRLSNDDIAVTKCGRLTKRPFRGPRTRLDMTCMMLWYTEFQNIELKRAECFAHMKTHV
jgi:hypothetical protein